MQALCCVVHREEVTRNNTASMTCTGNAWIFNLSISINWRASLVPAAAVIPASIAYIKVVAVEQLVVGFLLRVAGPPIG